MATNDSTGVDTGAIPPERVSLALDAAGQLEDLFMAMLDQGDDGSHSYRAEPVYRAFAARGLVLARATMSALDEAEETVPTLDLQGIVNHG